MSKISTKSRLAKPVLDSALPEVQKPPQLAPIEVTHRYSIEQACLYLDLCRASVYTRIAQGTIRSFNDGARRFIAGSELARLCRGSKY